MNNKLLILISAFFLGFTARSQCNWTTVLSESFEYSTVIPGIIPGTTYQNTPQTYPGTIHAGSKGMYLNIVDGFTGLIYSQEYNNLCATSQYRVSFWTRDAFSSSNNFTFRVVDLSDNVLATQTVVTNSVWQQVTLPAFTPAGGAVKFEIVTNLAGGPGNDGGFDDFVLQQCTPVPTNTLTATYCQGAAQTDLFTLLSNVSQNGAWTGPSPLGNGYLGTLNPATNTSGQYVYTIDGGPDCPDSTSTVQVTITSQPNINTPAPVSSCGTYFLPAITGTNLNGNEHYYTGPNGTGTMLATGSGVTTSQTIYIYGGAAGCSDQEILNVTISTPSNAGQDNSASYCGSGQTVNLAAFLSAGTVTSGTWAETTSPSSGGLTPATAQWNTQGIAPGTYTFTYTLPANGACPADVANFSMIIGNLPAVNLGNDTTLCPGQTITLNATGPYDTYQWNNGSTNPTRFVSAAGTYSVKVGKLGTNQIVNGDFELAGTNFTSDYTVGTGGSWGLLSVAGTYLITTSPNLGHQHFLSCNDHTPNPGNKQMVVNGADQANKKVWCQNVVTSQNTDYQFGTWVTSVINSPDVAQLQFSINATQLGSIFSPPATACNWTQFTQTWNSGASTSAQICIINQNTSEGGNDFALDDITFRPICFSRDTIVVAYSTNPVVNIGPAQNVCEGTQVILDAQNPGFTYLWNTGATTQTIEPVTSGPYSVTVKNQFNCSGTSNTTVNFEAQKHAGNDSVATLCSTTPQLDLTSLLQAGSTAGGVWETGDLPGTVTAAGIATTSAPGTFDFDYVLTGTYCPNDTARMVVTVNQQPVAAADQLLHHCNTPGEIVDLSGFDNHPQEPNPSFWNSPDFPAANMNEAAGTLDLTGIAHGVYHIYDVLAADSMCVNDTMKVELKVTAVPVVGFNSDVTEGCQPLAVEFYDNSTVQGNAVYSWNLGNGQTSSSATDINGLYPSADCYDVTLTITADGLCTSTLTKPSMICSRPLPVASFEFGPQQVYSDGPVVNFTNNSVDYVSSAWDFGDETGSSETHPVHDFPLGITGNYLVVLTVTSQYGCTDETSKIVQVKDQLLYFVPNTFTPDGDEYNNVFLPVMSAGIDPADYHFVVYNRWGEILFESSDVNTGWDGTYHGELLREGTYVWKIEFGLIDTDERKTQTGHLNLLR